MNPTDITPETQIDNGVHRGVRFMQILEKTIPDKDIPIQVDAQFMGGTPVIYGTRIPVYVILELLQADYSIKEIIEEIYPHLTYEQICQTLLYITDFFTPGKELLNSIVKNREQKLSEIKSNLDIESKKDVLMMLAGLFDSSVDSNPIYDTDRETRLSYNHEGKCKILVALKGKMCYNPGRVI
jgi:uncharacterized protein (DUF433 family)